jgi:hypothetical protein
MITTSLTTGYQRPRLESVPPAVSTSAATDTIELASYAGLHLDDWQCHVLTGALGKRADGKWSAFQVKLLVSRQNGKGSILEARELAGLYLFKTDRLLIHTAHEHKTASEHYNRVWALIQNSPELDKRVARHSSAYGREFIALKPGPTVIFGSGGREIVRNEPSRLIFIARTGASGRGFTGDFLAYDEDMILKAAQVGSSLPALGARPNPQVWYTGSAGGKESEQLAHVRNQGVDAAEGLRPPGRLAFFEWSINWHSEYCTPECTEHDDPASEESVAKANPAYNIRRSPDAIAAERDALTPEQFDKEILGVCEYPSPEDGWATIPKSWFAERFDNSEQPPRVTSPVFAIEVAHDRSTASISVAGLRPDRLVGVQVVEYKNGTGWLTERVKDIHERWKPVTWVIDKRAATNTIIAELEREGIPLELMIASDVAAASGMLYDAFRDDTVRHYGQSSFKAALAASAWRKLGESRAFDRINPSVDQTPVMSAAFAHWGYLRFGVEEDYDAADSVHLDLAEIKRLYRMGVYGPEDIRRLHDMELISENDLRELANAGISF